MALATETIRIQEISSFRPTTLSKADWRNLALLLVGFACVLLLVSPAHSYPVNDDWIYARGVQDLLHLDYKLPGAQATSFAPIALGALLSWLFGFSFTTLTAATLLMSAACIVLFYLLLRAVNLESSYALFGTALLALNPIFVYLSYSFMTDVTFLALMLAACLFYLRAMQTGGEYWLWFGGVAVSLAYLTRQFGILLVPAALSYLWWSRQWSWRKAVVIVAIPAVVAAIYMLWERTQPVPLASMELERIERVALADPLAYLMDRVQRVDWVLTIPGLLLLPLLWKPRRILLTGGVFVVLVVLQLRSAHDFGTLLPAFGNVVDHTGFVMGFYSAAPIWNESTWTILGVAGSLAVAVCVTLCYEQVASWVSTRPWRSRLDDPVLLVYVFGALYALVVFLLPLFLFDRYLLPLMPVITIMSLRRISSLSGTRLAAWRWLLILPMALFALLAQHDYNAHAAARWQAGESLVAQGVPREHIDAGFEWDGWYMFDAGDRRIRETKNYTYLYFPAYAAIDPVYVISDLPREGYTQIGSVPYDSWLTGGEIRRVAVLKRK